MTKIENGWLSTEGRGTTEHLVQCRCQVRLAEEEEQTKEMESRTKAATKYYRKRLAGGGRKWLEEVRHVSQRQGF